MKHDNKLYAKTVNAIIKASADDVMNWEDGLLEIPRHRDFLNVHRDEAFRLGNRTLDTTEPEDVIVVPAYKLSRLVSVMLSEGVRIGMDYQRRMTHAHTKRTNS